jgi:hypothetical protein
MVDRCVGVFDLRLHYANHQVIAREREYFSNSWRDKKKKKKKALKDRHYAITVGDLSSYLDKKSHFLQISSAGPSGSKKVKKNPNKALEEFVQQQNDSSSDVSVCC